MPPERKRDGLLTRILRRLGFRRRDPGPRIDDLPPPSGVREPRRPRPGESGGAVALEPPPTEQE